MRDLVGVATILGGLVALGIVCRFVWRLAGFLVVAAETLGELRPNGGGSVKDKVDALGEWQVRFEGEDREWKRRHTELDESRFAELSVKVDELRER